MNQMLTGQFIKAMRKEQGLTQRELAERLNISEKTVSKWETGKGLPDVGLMLPLSKVLGISVNELLSGQKLDEKQYIEKAEENLAALMADKCSPKMKLVTCYIALALTIICVGLIVACTGYDKMDDWIRITLVICALLSMVANVSLILIIGISIEIFECPECGTKFAATPYAYIMGAHTITKRRLKCPHCGKKSWCRSFWRR